MLYNKVYQFICNNNYYNKIYKVIVTVTKSENETANENNQLFRSSFEKLDQVELVSADDQANCIYSTFYFFLSFFLFCAYTITFFVHVVIRLRRYTIQNLCIKCLVAFEFACILGSYNCKFRPS